MDVRRVCDTIAAMNDLLWDRSTNPNDWVARELGIPRHVLRERLHKIKKDAGLGGADDVRIKRSGAVIGPDGEEIGNLL
jgi:hypothetical protein